MSTFVLPYKTGSKSAKDLAIALGLKRLKTEGSKAKPKVVLNWGNAKDHPAFKTAKVINKPEAVAVASNKTLTFKALEKAGVSHVPFTTSKETAQKWLQEGAVVFARTNSGHSGSGIEIVEPGQTLPNKPLYTKYIKKKKEFRVHVFKDKIVDVQEKRRKSDTQIDEPRIRSNHNGYVFCHENIVEPKGLRELAVSAVSACGLDFGAVDIIWNEKSNKSYVLEINTAPGLAPSTVEKYKNVIQGSI